MFGTYEVKSSKKNHGLAILFFSACLAYSAHLLFNKPPSPVSLKWSLLFKDTHQAAIFCLVTLTPFVIFSLKQFFSGKPVLIVDSRGFYDSRHVKDVIPWRDIVATGTQSMDFLGQNLDVLMIELTTSGKQDARFKLLYYLNAGFYRTGNANVVCFHLNGLEYDQMELIHALQTRRTSGPQRTSHGRAPVSAGRLFN
ncbi:hypothetical protein N9W89_03420 [Hellea sp.]|nr:hypothetical protein [Hellea sp.]